MYLLSRDNILEAKELFILQTSQRISIATFRFLLDIEKALEPPLILLSTVLFSVVRREC